MKSKTKRFLLITGIILGLGISFIAFAFSFKSNNKSIIKEAGADTVAISIQREFGIPVDSFAVIDSTISRNEFLAAILQQYHTNPQTIALLAKKSKEVFDIRNLKAGSPYMLFCTKDSLKKACYFVYQPNPIDYVVYDMRDSIHIYKGKREVVTQTREVSGVVNHSLFEALHASQADPALAMKLAKIYAWDIDFYAIHKGDWFKVVYDQQYVKDKPVGIGRIKTAVFNHDGKGFYAFHFQSDSTDTDGYFDEQARSLRKAFLKAPLKFFHITSHYTKHRFHPIQHRWKAHLGTDYAAPTGTPIMSTAAGVVVASRYSQFNGNYVKVRHNSVYTTQYLHMSKRAVRVGQQVKQGEVIGYVGSTGLATGPHVCYRFWKNGVQVNPLKQKFPPATPIKESDMPAFRQLVARQKAFLENIPMDTTPPAVMAYSDKKH